MRVVTRPLITTTAALAAGFLLGWLVFGQPVAMDQLVATVGEQTITEEEMRFALIRRGGSKVTDIDRTAVLEELLLRKAMMEQARMSGLLDDPLVRWNQQSAVVNEYRARMLTPRLEAIQPTDADLATWYQQHAEDYRQPQQRRLAILFLRTSAGKTGSVEEAVAKLQKAADVMASREQARSGFAELAVSYSEDQASRYRGGDIGWFTEGKPTRWPAALSEAAFALVDVGAVSAPLVTEAGVYLVMVTEIRLSRIQPLNEVKGKVWQALIEDHKQSVTDEFRASVMTGLSIKVWENRVQRIELPMDQLQPSLLDGLMRSFNSQN